jgi:hypothetical protein
MMDENSIYWYIQVYVLDIPVYACIYYYSYTVTGFRGGHRDAVIRDASQPPVEQEPEEGDPSPCPEHEEYL